MIDRRTVLIGGAATGLSSIVLSARAQAPSRDLPLIGFMHVASPEPFAPMVSAFLNGLAQGGFVPNRNARIDYRWAEGQHDRLRVIAAELVAMKPAVIVAPGGFPVANAARSATGVIPILFSVTDPVESGLIASLARPGANLTGISLQTNELTAKRLELLLELVPAAATVALLVDPNSARIASTVSELTRLLDQARRRVEIHEAASAESIDRAFNAMAGQRPDALVVATGAFFMGRRDQIVRHASRLGIPSSFDFREFVVAGGLMSYGASLTGSYNQLGGLTARILNGAHPAELPVQQPVKYELVVNLNTLRALGLSVPQSLQLRIDEVIE